MDLINPYPGIYFIIHAEITNSENTFPPKR